MCAKALRVHFLMRCVTSYFRSPYSIAMCLSDHNNFPFVPCYDWLELIRWLIDDRTILSNFIFFRFPYTVDCFSCASRYLCMFKSAGCVVYVLCAKNAVDKMAEILPTIVDFSLSPRIAVNFVLTFFDALSSISLDFISIVENIGYLCLKQNMYLP